MKPTTMLYRNLASMEVEETLRANPLDGVVLLTGCDKTTPACLMGACSVDLPEAELARRRRAWVPPAPRQERGYARLYTDHVLQADRGADLDFPVGGSGSQVYREYR